jgi:hypothetical protein
VCAGGAVCCLLFVIIQKYEDGFVNSHTHSKN